MISPLANEARIVAELRQRLKAEYGICDGDDVLEDTLEGQTNLPEMLATMARDAIQALDYHEAVEQRIRIMKERADRLERRYDKLRAEISWALQESGWKKIPADVLPELGVTLSPGKKPLHIDDENDIPNLYRQPKPTEYTIDRKGLRGWLEGGATCPGARLGNAQPVLTIRSR